MKVLHIQAGSLDSGSAKGAYQLHSSLLDIGIDSKLLSTYSSSVNDKSLVSISSKSKFLLLKQKVSQKLANLSLLAYPNRKQWIFSTGFSGINISSLKEFQESDIIHLHWINGLLPLNFFSQISKPIVWTLRDMWPFTGGCHYSMGCSAYLKECGSCTQLNSKFDFDLSNFVLSQKKRYLKSNITPVAISKWLQAEASQSQVFSNYNVRFIRNCIDLSSFFPDDRSLLRIKLGINDETKILLIGAQNIADFYKGFDLFAEALSLMKLSRLHILSFGDIPDDFFKSFRVHHTNLGFLRDPSLLRSAYSSADVFVAPSRMEAFGKTLAESLACGTPVVCFVATGPKDIVDHKKTGFKASPYSPLDLASGIEWILNLHPVQYMNMRAECRQTAFKLYNSNSIALEYSQLYSDILEKHYPVI